MADGSSVAALELLLVGGVVGWLFYSQATNTRRHTHDRKTDAAQSSDTPPDRADRAQSDTADAPRA